MLLPQNFMHFLEPGKTIMDNQQTNTQLQPIAHEPFVGNEKQKRRELQEEKVWQHEKNVFKVGEALQVLKEEKLYPNTYKNFGVYCKDVFDISPRHANHWINASKTMKYLVQFGNNCSSLLPTNESQVRPLASFEPKQQVQVWEKIIEKADGRRITADLVKRTVAEHKSDRSDNKDKLALQGRAVKKIGAVLAYLDQYTPAQLGEFLYSSEHKDLPEIAQKIAQHILLALETLPPNESCLDEHLG